MRTAGDGPRGAEHAILLRREPRGEADERLALLGEERGLFWVTARGGRRSKKRFVGVLEPFTRATWDLVRKGRTEYVEAVEHVAPRDRVPRELGRYYSACYACEAASRVLRVGEPAPEVFALVRALLDDMQASLEVAHLLWRALLEAGLLESQGQFPELDPALATGESLAYDMTRSEWVPPGEGEAPTRVELPTTSWAGFLALRELPLAEARAASPPPEELRPVNRLVARLFRYQLQLDLRSASLLNKFQRDELAKLEEGEVGSDP